MNLGAIKKRLCAVQARLAANGADQQFPIARGGGMLALKTAIEAAVAARQNAPPSLPLGDMPSAPSMPMARLRADMLAEQKRRAELWAITPLELLLKQPAIVDETEAPEPRAIENMKGNGNEGEH